MQSPILRRTIRVTRLMGMTVCCVIFLCISPLKAQDTMQGEGAAAQEQAGQQQRPRHDSSRPVDITSDSLEVDDKSGIFVFRGDVVARQDDATIYSDQLDVYYTRNKAPAEAGGADNSQSRSIEKIVARGSVRIVQQERIATGERAEYVYADGFVILTGSPRVVQGDNTIAGEKITVYLDRKQSIVEGGSQERVQATFVPKEDGDQ